MGDLRSHFAWHPAIPGVEKGYRLLREQPVQTGSELATDSQHRRAGAECSQYELGGFD
jgi:hypothetical protein